MIRPHTGFAATRLRLLAVVLACGFAALWPEPAATQSGASGAPPPPIIGTSVGQIPCSEPSVSAHLICQEWRKQFEAYQAGMRAAVPSPAQPAPSATLEAPPLMPRISTSFGEMTCDEAAVETHPVCVDWRRKYAAWQARTQSQRVAQLQTQQGAALPGPPYPPTVATGGDFEDFSCDEAEVASRPVCQMWRRDVEAYWAKVRSTGAVQAPTAIPSAQQQVLGSGPPLPPLVGGFEGETTVCTDPQVASFPICRDWRLQVEAYRAKVRSTGAAQAPAVIPSPAEQQVLGSGPPMPPTVATGGDFEDFSCEDSEVFSRPVCQMWRRDVEAYWANVEALRKRLAEQEGLKRQAEAERKAAEERARREAEVKREEELRAAEAKRQAEAERKAAEAKRRAEALRKQIAEEERLRRQAEAEREAAGERAQIEALRKRLEQEEKLRRQAEAEREAAEEQRRLAEERTRREAEKRDRRQAEAQREAERKAAEAQREAEKAAQAKRRAQLTAGLSQVSRFNEVVIADATVRELPEAGAKAVRKLQLGEQVHVVGELASGWVQVAREGVPIGWLHGSAVRQRLAAAPRQREESAALSAAPAPLPPLDRPTASGRNYALVIGNNDYANLPNLKTAVGDAAAVAELLKLRYTFEPGDVKLLLNAGRRTILDELAHLRRRLHEEDRLLIYYAGHGVVDAATAEGFWQPVDAEIDKSYTWIANYEVRLQLRGIPARHVLVVADSCFSGTLTRAAPDYSSIPKDRFFAEIDSSVSRKAISSGGTEPVADVGSGGNSVFAYYFLKVLRNNRRPFITSFELFNNLVRAVTNNSNQKPTYGTVSDAGDEGMGDFTFVLR